MKVSYILLLLISLQGVNSISSALNMCSESFQSHTNTSMCSKFLKQQKKSFFFKPTPELHSHEFYKLSGSVPIKDLSPHLLNDEDHAVVSNGCVLHGTLLLPINLEKAVPLVIIIAGSGPTDRNGNSILLPAECNKYKMLAEQLATNQIATFRYDKRAVGSSRLSPELRAELVFIDYVNDAIKLIEYFKQDKRFSHIIIAGHSEGSLIGMLSARFIEYDAFISISGSGRNIGQALVDQIDAQIPGNPLIDTVSVYINKLRAGETIEVVNPSLISIFHPSIQNYLSDLLQYDPADEIKRLDIPVLLVQGTTDTQTNESDVRLLHMAKPSAKLAIIDGMNHALKTASIHDVEANYNSELPINKKLVEVIVRFINTL